jgi:DNA repair exonuclease SbcCD ATPase subunit
MDLILRSQQSDLQKKLTEVRHQCELIKSKYETEAKYLKSLEDQGTDFQTGKQKSLEKNRQSETEYREKIKQLNIEIESTNSLLVDKDKVKGQYNQLTKLEGKIENNLSNHQKTLDFFLNNDNCPTCTQPIEEEFKSKKKIEETTTIQKLETGLEELLQEITKTEEKVTEMSGVSKKVQDLNVEVAKIETSLQALKTSSDSIHEEILISKNRDSDITTIKLELNELSKSLVEADEALAKVNEEKSYVDILREILNDKGAKAQIIRKYVPIMNSLINKYLQAMDFYISFVLDEEFNETVKSRFRDNFNYNNFSEGEKMRIDLALLFTWRDIARMKNSTNTNLLILDEIFDSSLDGQGTDDFFKIIKTLTKENIFIISHKGDILFDKFAHIIKYEKHNNFTQLGTV